MGESDQTMHIQRRGDYESIEEPLEGSEKRRGCRCKLDGSVIKLIGATLCIAGAIATCTLSYYYSKHTYFALHAMFTSLSTIEVEGPDSDVYIETYVNPSASIVSAGIY